MKRLRPSLKTPFSDYQTKTCYPAPINATTDWKESPANECPPSIDFNSSFIPWELLIPAIFGKSKFGKWATRGLFGYRVAKVILEYVKKTCPPNSTRIEFQGSYGELMNWISSHPDFLKLQANSYKAFCGSSLVPSGIFKLPWENYIATISQVGEKGKEYYCVDLNTKDRTVCERFLTTIKSISEPIRTSQMYSVIAGESSHLKDCSSHKNLVLPEGTFEDIDTDLSNFIGAKDWYEKCGIPYRRSYLLAGARGAGNSTTVEALCSKHNRSLYRLLLSTFDDSSLHHCVQNLDRWGILLIEEIDCAFQKRENDEASWLTFSGFLTAIEANANPEGRIIFFTTNHVDQLDSALLRPGRIDKRIDFNTATKTQISKLTANFNANCGKPIEVDVEAWANEGLCMATVQERLIELYNEHAN